MGTTHDWTLILDSPETQNGGSGVKTWPNPAGDLLFVSTGMTDAITASCRIFNLYGQLLFQDNLPVVDGGIQLAVNELPPGFYVLFTEVEERPLIAKFVK